ncbi:MAG: hypothetical protein PHT33_13640, partial [bacterium]|nr:hypothetical protein [bacterium]
GKSPAVVELRLETADKIVLRRMMLKDGSRVVDIRTTVTSKKSDSIDWNYWVNMLVTPGGRMLGSGHNAFVPAASGKAADSGSANGSAIEMLIESGYSLQEKASISSDTLMEGPPGNSVSFNVKPVQPWRAVIHTETLEGIGNLLDPGELEGMVTYFCSSGEDSTMEVIFPKRTYKPGDTVSYHLELVALKGMERIDWMGPDMAVACKGPRMQALDKDSGLQFKVLPLHSDKNMKASIRLRSVKDAAVFGPWTVALKGSAVSTEDVSLKVPVTAIPEGIYELLIGGDDAASLILGRLVKVTK